MRNKKPASLMFSFAIFALFSVVGSTEAQQIKNAIPDVARPLPLSAVRLTAGPLKHAQDLDIDYLLKLEPDRMMAYPIVATPNWRSSTARVRPAASTTTPAICTRARRR